MTTTADAALLAAHVYRNGRSSAGVAPIAQGWTEIDYVASATSGFTGGAYKNTTTNEIVIAFKGSDDVLDYVNNVGLTTGIPTPQIVQAALMYADIRAKNPGATITFTGHSLGGGLASVMSVMFDRASTAFAIAPFAATALSPAVIGVVAATLAANGYVIPEFDAYARNAAGLYGAREQLVTHYFVEGEVLEPLRVFFPETVGANNRIEIGSPDIGAVQRHSIDLHAALLSEDKFRQASERIPELLGMAMNEKLYATAGDSNLITVLLRGKVGYAPTGTPDSDLLTRFSEDALRIAQPGAIAVQKLREAVTLATIEYYHDMRAGYRGAFVTEGDGYIAFQLDRASIPVGSEAQTRLFNAVREIAGNHPAARNAADFYARDQWYVQAGTDAMNVVSGDSNDVVIGAWGNDRVSAGGGNDFIVTDRGNDWIDAGAGNDVVIAGAGDDFVAGGAGDDALDGGAGNDILAGGQGNDVLAGGKGNDTYLFGRGDGRDTILEVDPRSGSFDTVRFGENIRFEDLLWRRAGASLEVSLRDGSGDALVLADWYRSSNNRVEQFVTADGRTVLESQVAGLVAAMAGFAAPASGKVQVAAEPGAITIQLSDQT